MAININWGEIIKNVAPAAVSAVAGGLQARAVNQTERDRISRDSASEAARLALDREKLALDQSQLQRAAENDAIRNMMRASLLNSAQDVSIDRSGFRSRVPNVSFSGGARPSAIGNASEIAALMNDRAKATFANKPSAGAGGGGGAVPRSGAPAGDSGGGSSFWEKALAGGSLAATLGPSIWKAMRGGGKSAVPGLADSAIDASKFAGGAGRSVMGTLNGIAGPAGMAAGIAAPFLPEGKARGAASGASTGATIGSFVPGVGTAVGAGVGALVGAIAGNKNSTAGDREDFAKQAGFQNLGQLYDALGALGPEGAQLREVGLNVIGKKDKEANAQWMQQVAALLGSR